MATANPFPADYDSDEDVIEVALPPPSSSNQPTRSTSSRRPPHPLHLPAPEQEDAPPLVLPAPRRRFRFDRRNPNDQFQDGTRHHVFRDPVARATIHQRMIEHTARYQRDSDSLTPTNKQPPPSSTHFSSRETNPTLTTLLQGKQRPSWLSPMPQPSKIEEQHNPPPQHLSST